MVPVLPQRISSQPANFSGAFSFLTRIPSLNIFITEKAKDTPTVSGRPSGIAITMSTTTRLICYGILSNRISAAFFSLAPTPISVKVMMTKIARTTAPAIIAIS